MKRKTMRTGGVNLLSQMVVLVLGVSMVVVLAGRQLLRSDGGKPSVIAAAMSLPQGTVLATNHLVAVEVDPPVPAAVYQNSSDLLGKTLTRAKVQGRAFVAADFDKSNAGRASMSRMIPEGRVLSTLTVANLTIPYQSLSAGDRVDVLASGVGTKRVRESTIVVRDAHFLGYAAPRTAKSSAKKNILGVDLTTIDGRPKGGNSEVALLLAVKPAEVLRLALFDGSGSHISLVLHHPEDVKKGALLPFGRSDSVKTIELIMGEKRESITVP